MITLDQVLLLQKKVEAAVEKIISLGNEVSQLKSENDALRSECAELTNALSEKTKLVSAYQAQQDKIEDTILKALNRLDTVENNVLDSIQSVSSKSESENNEESENNIEEDVVSENPENNDVQEEISVPKSDSENKDENFSSSDQFEIF